MHRQDSVDLLILEVVEQKTRGTQQLQSQYERSQLGGRVCLVGASTIFKGAVIFRHKPCVLFQVQCSTMYCQETEGPVGGTGAIDPRNDETLG